MSDLSTDELDALFASILMYPNPASEVLKIDGLPSDAVLYLLDAKGAVVKEFANVSTLDVSEFARGSYQLMIRVGSAFGVKKVVLK